MSLTKEQLEEKIKESGGTYIGTCGLKFEMHKTDGSVEVFDGGLKVGWITGGTTDDFYMVGMEIQNSLKYCRLLASEFKIEADGPSLINQPNPAESNTVQTANAEITKQLSKMSGMVEAYEKLIIGRHVTVSR